MVNEKELHQIIDTTIRDVFGADSLLSSELTIAPDHDGEESLFIDIDLKDKNTLQKIDLQNKFREKFIRSLHSLSDYRFPYIRYDYGDSKLTRPDKITFRTRKSIFR